MVRKADHDLSKATALLRRRRDAVRRELRRREYDGAATGAGAGAGGSFVVDKADDGTIRLNPDFDRRSSMAAMGFETRTRTTVEALRREELRIEGDYLRLVEKASRLASLRLRSEELIGKQHQIEYAQRGNAEVS